MSNASRWEEKINKNKIKVKKKRKQNRKRNETKSCFF